jgi:hypothetical protein
VVFEASIALVRAANGSLAAAAPLLFPKMTKRSHRI